MSVSILDAKCFTSPNNSRKTVRFPYTKLKFMLIYSKVIVNKTGAGVLSTRPCHKYFMSVTVCICVCVCTSAWISHTYLYTIPLAVLKLATVMVI